MPPGRSTRAASSTARPASATNCSAPNAEKTTSNASSGNGSAVAVPATTGHPDAGLVVDAAGVLELARAEVEADGPGAARGQPAGALAGAAADLEHPAAGHVAEHPRVRLVHALGAPDEADVAEELAVGGLVLVGVGVPVAAVGPLGVRLRDRTTGGLHGTTPPAAGRYGGTRVEGRHAPTIVGGPAGSIGAVDGYGLQPLAGGHSGETFLAEAAGERTVVRIYGERSARPGARGARTSTRPCSTWCAGCCRCPRCSTSGAPTPRPARPACSSPRSCRGSGSTCCCPELDESVARGGRPQRRGACSPGWR